MIVFDKVSKKFPLGNFALNEVSFEIDNNEFLFLVGPSGAGKTSVIKLILKELLPSSGSILIDDEDISSPVFKKVTELRRKIGVVFQDFKILLDKNVFENIAIACQIKNLSHSQTKNQVKEALSLVNLSKKEGVFPVQLSAGELQRVAIARAIADERKYLLVDEPTGNLDPKTSWEIMKIFKKLEGKKTIIIATHNSDIVNSFQKRVLVLKEGKLVKDQRKGGYNI
ncbi:cell division ATP-binding protein FtsE [Candidatus Roizmanbacteria bacterium CG_4_10_14_0_2_um_filter_36_35]|uniref:Cell division ATP-binding protein FtsE n=4 Tax=Candidatus Roizmaniibacteriota TaxID=1752723 RepID=A0A2M7BWY1_9BACT|nr:MAG: cell division ATP-binding protein FtsE [Candidatus Roizmanbacteria bacterium CG11_big_fil_rev_8_21_14_0_20_35_14]PIV11083.1 MAG: cell division ATP-binding protein FtsE [Candidatus Roizmanbacteria bacterium CG03_land_8_20_14_0_80_35_26]PIZ67886.1 MAG: cell division ATP-binding protein FtsE [Candidatus Roizmanbacteria bacterium CG_4_10_14_0_2_um_filter_36_35]PJC32808.1 MAG: cell division ATP-binding protein FtsE [Candidatus Roizmanbacteria bacterium CG_4_9_14_0_2_um_filter_36_12]PJC81006.